jgi:hypothetical protein
MKAINTIVAWDDETQLVRVGPHPAGRWLDEYTYSGLGDWTYLDRLSPSQLRLYVLHLAWDITHNYGIHAKRAHEAFMAIDEYREALDEVAELNDRLLFGWWPGYRSPGSDDDADDAGEGGDQ